MNSEHQTSSTGRSTRGPRQVIPDIFHCFLIDINNVVFVFDCDNFLLNKNLKPQQQLWLQMLRLGLSVP